MGIIRKLLRDGRAATAVEYGLFAALIAIAMLVGLRSTGESLNDVMSTAATAMEG